ncbi:unnamed protein product [Paramecium sonneborni]|uniref:Tetratricopeptide repeat protein n=1 Tax=Paramecium sonneborni TaxID=65129 RepID=A0A8S1RR36_9CILI|nr:unnamed protein product [Paramecium sonneborni]
MYEKANILTKLQGFQEAIQIYQDIIKMNPKHDLSYQKIVIRNSINNQQNIMINAFQQMQIIQTLNLEKVNAQEKLTNIRKPYNILSKLLKMSHLNQIITLAMVKNIYKQFLGDCLLYLYKYDEALKNYDKCLKIDDNHDDSQAGKGTCLLLLGKKDVALEYINQSLKIKQNSCLSQIKPQKYSIIFYLIHQVLFYKYIVAIKEQLDYEEALEQFENVLIIDPEYLYSLYNKGNFILYFYRQLLIFYGSI